jgi:ABC-type Mn2+/Zn2+ transport system ATPase subunit
MANDNVIIRFSDATFEYGHNKLILDEASFSVRSGSRITLMGQNGAGKSSLFKLITGEMKLQNGAINFTPRDASIAIARQVMPREMMDLTIRDYFASAFTEIKYNLDKLIREVFEVVNVNLPLEKTIKEFSGGQQDRILLSN